MVSIMRIKTCISSGFSSRAPAIARDPQSKGEFLDRGAWDRRAAFPFDGDELPSFGGFFREVIRGGRRGHEIAHTLVLRHGMEQAIGVPVEVIDKSDG